MKRTFTLALASLAAFAVAVGVAGAASSPTVSTGSATTIRNTSAVLNGSVNPNGGSTHYWFVWGPTTAYGATSAHHSAGSGTRSVSVRVGIGSLLPGTRYHYRLIAQNASGTTMGADRTFRTTGHPLPGVVTGNATSISAHSAIINGTVLPNGQTTVWTFQWGTGGVFFTTAPGSVPGSAGPTNVAQTIPGLAAGTTYQFRLVGQHPGFTNYGAFNTFTTFPLVRPYPRGLQTSTRPSRDRSKPFVYTTSGKLVPSLQFPAAPQCYGNVSVSFFVGKRRVAQSRPGVLADCSFTSTAIFTHTFAATPGGKRPGTQTLQVQVRFTGNGYIAPSKNIRITHVTLG